MRSSRTLKNRRKNGFPIFTTVLVFVIIAAGIWFSLNFVNSTLANNKNSISDLSVSKINPNQLYSENVILVDVLTGKTLFKKNENQRCYPASLTKIMTAYTAITERESLDKTITMSSDIFSNLNNKNASMAGYNQGEKTTVNDLLYGCLLASGADAAIGLADATTGSEGSFVNLMNEKADEVGLSKTNFVNSTGLHDDEHYSTAKDMAKLLKYALANQTFRDVFTTDTYNIKTNRRDFTVNSTFFSEYMGKTSEYTVEGAKTGTTSKAGQCLASLVSKGGREYILITLHAPSGGSMQPFSFDDLDYIFKTI